MKKQWPALLVVAFLSLFCAVVDTSAQTTYNFYNYSATGIAHEICIQTDSCECLPVGSIPPGGFLSFPLPTPCTILGIRSRGILFPLFTSGAPAPGPNPPPGLFVTVTGVSTIFF